MVQVDGLAKLLNYVSLYMVIILMRLGLDQ